MLSANAGFFYSSYQAAVGLSAVLMRMDSFQVGACLVRSANLRWDLIKDVDACAERCVSARIAVLRVVSDWLGECPLLCVAAGCCSLFCGLRERRHVT